MTEEYPNDHSLFKLKLTINSLGNVANKPFTARA